MENLLLTISRENKEIFICGDFNFDLKVPDNSSENSFNMMASYGLFPTILIPTRVERNSSTIIDNIFTNINENELQSGVIESNFSDHYSQFISLKNHNIDLRTVKIYRRDYSNFSEVKFREDVAKINLTTNSDDVNEQFDHFYSKLEECVDKHAPIKKLKPKEIKFQKKPWISSELQKMIRIKNKLFSRKKRQPSNENIRRLYNLFRNRVNREKGKAKTCYYNKYFQENSSDSKKVWEGIKSLINTKNNNMSSISQLEVDGNIINEPQKWQNLSISTLLR